jgi:hypothetical protein
MNGSHFRGADCILGQIDGARFLFVAPTVPGADTNRLELALAPQAAGLLAASLGLSRMYRDDLAQIDAGMILYDAFYRWARDASGESHDWPSPTQRS